MLKEEEGHHFKTTTLTIELPNNTSNYTMIDCVMLKPKATYFLILVSLILGLIDSVHAQDTTVTPLPKPRLEPFLMKYCVRCHGPEKQNGDVRFDEVSWRIKTNDEAQRWQDVLDVLNGADMPPEDEPQPTSEELSKALGALTNTLVHARKRLTDKGGEIAMRRLNRREYDNSINSLFGFGIVPHLAPDDAESEIFDTVGDHQFFTSSHFDKYLVLGQKIAATGFRYSGAPRRKPKTYRFDPAESLAKMLREKKAKSDEKMVMKNARKTWEEMGFKDEGEAKIFFSRYDRKDESMRTYLGHSFAETGVYFTGVGINNTPAERMSIRVNGADPRGYYKVRVRGGIVGDPLEIRKFIKITGSNGQVRDVLKLKGTPEVPEIVETSIQARYGEAFAFQVAENRSNIRGYFNKLGIEGDPPSLWIDWIEFEGPFYHEESSGFGKIFYPTTESGKSQKLNRNDSDAPAMIKAFVLEAFRHRDPGADYIDSLVTLFQEERKEGSNFDLAMQEVLSVVLASPGFLFLSEADPVDEKSKLSARELAIRLSYFLWSGPPDEELYRCAADASLLQPNVLQTQVDRLLNHRKSAAFFEGFAGQWMELDRFDAITVDENDYFLFNAGIRQSARKEVPAFFEELVRENLPTSNLIDSDFVVIDNLLANHYEIDGVDSNSFHKVNLPADSPRGGLLGQTAFLTLGSNGERSSPVIRGALVMEKLLHNKPAPPPPNVPELGSATDEPLTNRQMVALHQKQAQCASCHKVMDVIGFGLENFDAIGKWRADEMVGNGRKKLAVPIEPGGTLPGGAAFNDIHGLKSVLLKEQDALARELVESLLAYSLGRVIEFSDADDVDRILVAIKEERYPLRSMVHEITSSQLFLAK